MENLFFYSYGTGFAGNGLSVLGYGFSVMDYRTTNDNEKVSIHIIIGADELGMAGGGGRAVSATFLQARKQT